MGRTKPIPDNVPESNNSGLNAKQEAFVEAYLRTWDASKAAREAGYSHKTAAVIGHENLRKPNIKARIDERLKELRAGSQMVIQQLTDIARGDMGDFMVLSEDGESSLNLSNAKDKLHLIKKVTFKKTITKDDTVIQEASLELYSRQDALDTLTRIHGLLAPTQLNQNHTISKSLSDAMGLTDPNDTLA